MSMKNSNDTTYQHALINYNLSMRSAIFRDFKQRRMAVYYRCFGTT